jgi:hypothetical protein
LQGWSNFLFRPSRTADTVALEYDEGRHVVAVGVGSDHLQFKFREGLGAFGKILGVFDFSFDAPGLVTLDGDLTFN